MLPADWLPIDSLATLLIAVAQADAPPDRKELDTVAARLRVLFPRVPPARCGEAVQRALEHLILQVNAGVELAPVDWLRLHCERLVEAYDEAARRSLVMELARVARASGGATPYEVELAAGIAAALGQEALGDAMLRQFEQAALRRAAGT